MCELLVYSCVLVRVQFVDACVHSFPFVAISARSMRIWSRRSVVRGVAEKGSIRSYPSLARDGVCTCVVIDPVYNPTRGESPRSQLGRSIPPSPLKNGVGVHLGQAPRPSTPRPHPFSGVVKRALLGGRPSWRQSLLGGRPSWRAIGGTIHVARICDYDQVV